MAFRLGELCGAADDALRYRLTLQAVNVWTMCACALIRGASFVLAGVDGRMSRLLGSEGVVHVLSVGVRCGWMKSVNVDQLEALGGCSIAGVLDEQAKRVLQLQREGGWVRPFGTQVLDVIVESVDQFPGLMRGPFALEVDTLVASMPFIAPVPAARAGSKGVVASVAALRAAFAAAKPILDGMAASTPAGQRPLFPVACCNVFCCRGGPALVGGGEVWVGPSDQPFCSRACMAVHLALCREVQG